MSIGIVTDDNSGFPLDEIERLGLFVVPMPIVIDGKDYFENRTITTEEFYKLQTSKDPVHDIHTAQPMPGDFFKVWDEALKVYDQILFIGMSSGLTGAIDTAKMLSTQEPYAGKVFVVDNHRISITLRHAIYDAVCLIKQGHSAQEIKDYLEATAKDSMIYIMVDTLEYLKRGGRVTAAGAALGGILHIKPILKIEGGKLDAKAKVIGTTKARDSMLKFAKEDYETMFKGKKEKLAFAVAYTENRQKALEFRHLISEQFGIDEEDIFCDPLSLSVAVHIGPGSLAIATSVLVDPEEIKK